MEVRITPLRVTTAALFVLAGVGLASLLSPMIGNALATVGTVANISDHSSSAYFAKVTSAGELKTNGVVSGKVAPALPPQPFAVTSAINYLGGRVKPLGPTAATIALTDVTFGNHFGNQARRLWLRQFSGPAPNRNCTASRERVVGVYDAGRAQTVHASFETPVVLKPLLSGDAWCLNAVLEAPAGDADSVDELSVHGYVLSGTYTPVSAPARAKAGTTMRKHADSPPGRAPPAR
jgi:hypothetical protein